MKVSIAIAQCALALAPAFAAQEPANQTSQKKASDKAAEQARLDAVKVDPKHYKIDFENDRVRVVRVQYDPHEKSAITHEHPGNSVGIYVTDFHANVTFPDGSTREVDGKGGKTFWRAPAVTHISTGNLSDQPMEALWVELKAAAAPENTNRAQEDEAAIRKIVADVQDAWNRGDAKALAAHISEDHDHINVDGAWRSGRAATENAVTAFLATKRINNTMSVAKIRFLTPDVAVVVIRNEYSDDQKSWKSISTSVFHKINGIWWNEAFQNTIVQPR